MPDEEILFETGSIGLNKFLEPLQWCLVTSKTNTTILLCYGVHVYISPSFFDNLQCFAAPTCGIIVSLDLRS